MKFGVFDHLDRNDLPLRDYYESRLKIAEAYDQHGFYAYHSCAGSLTRPAATIASASLPSVISAMPRFIDRSSCSPATSCPNWAAWRRRRPIDHLGVGHIIGQTDRRIS